MNEQKSKIVKNSSSIYRLLLKKIYSYYFRFLIVYFDNLQALHGKQYCHLGTKCQRLITSYLSLVA